MGTKNGFWVPCYLSFDDHEKTARLAASLVELGVPEAYAVDVAWGQWKRLAGWLVNQGVDGRLLSITPRAFAHIVRWDDVRKAKGLWDAWMDSGFIDDPRTENARLHDFREAFAHILEARERSAKRRDEKRAQRTNGSRNAPQESADSSRTVREQSANDLPPLRARVRTGPDRTGPDHRTPSESPFADAATPVGAAAPPVDPGKAAGKRAAAGAEPKAPTVDLMAAWKASAAAAGYPAVAVNGQHAKTLAEVWRAAGRDVAAVTRAVAAYFADRDPFTLRQAHGIGEFGRTSARWLAVAAGTAPAAAVKSRQADALDAAFDEAARLRAAGGAAEPEEPDRVRAALPPAVAASVAGVLSGVPR